MTIAVDLGRKATKQTNIEIKVLHFLTQIMLIMMTTGDFNTSEKASLPKFWFRLFNTKIALKIQRQLSYWLFYCYL